MIAIHIEFHSGIPVYRQVMDQIKYNVSSNLLQTGEQLPSIRELSKELAVNPTTIVKAYDELSHEGTIEKRRGKGVFVSDHVTTMNEKAQQEVISRLARQLVVEARQLGTSKENILKAVEEEFRLSEHGEG